ncbi:hypothetical protein OE699_01865 [Sedimentimonas flavescens]|uniref:Lipoprotein n=1 Tax=Sedimentimonas flavescens TaxID=2851012 RepID=A0ABT2ZV12_9RHOB|nr:hypothetical protein [Sedimentimonas flavescens]MCV2877585.1 hypothetical protein [Sedimentimonas flavescens]
MTLKLLNYAIGTIALVAVSGCVPTMIPIKNGVTYDRYERDTVGCAAESSRQVPTNTQVNWDPYIGIYSTDTNAKLRNSTNEICLRDKGYQMVQLPYCSGKALTAATEASKQRTDLRKVMHATSNSCYINRGDGTIYLYTPPAE